jgi:hypothetical protein
MMLRNIFTRIRKHLLLQSLLAPIAIVLVIVTSYFFAEGSNSFQSDGQVGDTAGYASVICPGALGGATATLSLPSKKLMIRSIEPGSTSLHRVKKLGLSLASSPIFVSGNPGTAIVFEKITPTSVAAIPCSAGGSDQWFIGGSGGVSNKGVLDVVNSGLSNSTVHISPFSTHGELAPITLVIKANSDRKISLASLAPGEASIALHVVAESGRICSFMLDHRKRGLKEKGSSFVAPQELPRSQVFLGGVQRITVGKSVPLVTMRFLVPGDVDADVQLTIHTATSSFTPLGFDLRTVAHQKVVDLQLPVMTNSGSDGVYGIEVNSDQPLFASALWNSDGDFAWTSALDSLSTFQTNLAGTHGGFVFMGASINLTARYVDSSGKSRTQSLVGQGEVVWAPKGALSEIQFTPVNSQQSGSSKVQPAIYGGAIYGGAMYGGAILSSGGVSSIALQAPVQATLSPAPISDLRVLTLMDSPANG